MQELTDDQLDGLFRKSAEEFEPPYDPAAWEAMNGQLDDRDRAAFWKKWLPWGIPLLLLLLMSGSWYVYDKVRPDISKSATLVGDNSAVAETKERNRLPSPQTQTLQSGNQESELSKPTNLPKPGVNVENKAEPSGKTSQTENQLLSKKLGHSSDKLAERPGNVLANTANNTVIITRKPATKGLATAYGERVNTSRRNHTRQTKNWPVDGTVSVDYVTNQKRTLRSLKHDRGIAGNKPSSIRNAGNSLSPQYTYSPAPSFRKRPSDSQIADTDIGNPNTLPNLAMTTPTGEERSGLPDMATLSILPAKWGKLMRLENLDVTVPERSEPTAMSVAIPAPQRGFSVRFAVAPDLSAVGLQNFTRPGTNYGAMLEYRMAERWSVQAGIMQSIKVYKAAGTDYEFPVLGYSVPESINGRCNMLDIPVNLRYDFMLRPRSDEQLQPSRWFVSGGVTSYVMLKEDYNYTYGDHAYKKLNGWSGNTGGYGLSHVNLSVGYERALTKRLSWQVEPFMKMPIRGVGYLKIDLLSTGAFFSIRYKL